MATYVTETVQRRRTDPNAVVAVSKGIFTGWPN